MLSIAADPKVALATGQAFIRRCEREGVDSVVGRVEGAFFPSLLRCLLAADAPAHVLRPVLEEAWVMNHQRLQQEGPWGRPLLALFRRAAFPIPDLPETFHAWRGTRGIDVGTAAQGLGWSPSFGTACRYAGAFTGATLAPGQTPLVIRRTVRREDVVFHYTIANEVEVLIDADPVDVVVDGDPMRWRAAADADLRELSRLGMELLRGPDCVQRRRAIQNLMAHKDRIESVFGRLEGQPVTDVAAVWSGVASRALVRSVMKGYRLSRVGIHGPAHWQRVRENGLLLAARTPGANRAVVELFALIHDSRRQDDGADDGHGERAAALVRDLARSGLLRLPPRDVDLLAVACARHELGEVSADPTIGCCWDADRLDLSRLQRRPIARLLSTAAALDPGVQAGAWTRGGGA